MSRRVTALVQIICALSLTLNIIVAAEIAAVVRSLDAYDAGVQAAQEAYRKEVEKYREKALKALAKEKAKQTRGGNLEAALAVAAEEKKLKAHQPGGLEKLDFLGKKIPAEIEAKAKAELAAKIMGTWSVKSGISGNTSEFKFKKNTVYCGAPIAKGDHKWKIESDKNRVIIYDTEEDPLFILQLPLPEGRWMGRYTQRPGMWVFTKDEK